MAFVFGRNRRLRKHSEFVSAQRSGRRVSTAHFILLVSARADRRAPSRLGLVVAKRVGGAVRRNRVKRLCRECFRAWPDLLPAGVDLRPYGGTGFTPLQYAASGGIRRPPQPTEVPSMWRIAGMVCVGPQMTGSLRRSGR